MKRLLMIAVLVLAGAVQGYGQCGPEGCTPPQQVQPMAPMVPVVDYRAAIVRITVATDSECGPDGCGPQRQPRGPWFNYQGRMAGHNLGSGGQIYVDEERAVILTCAHLFRDGSEDIRVTFLHGSGSEYDAKLLGTSATWDLAALEIPAPEIKTVIPISTSAPRPGDTVAGWGYGGPTNMLQTNTGRVTGYAQPPSGGKERQLVWTGPQRDGDSGGPVLNTKGELVAVLWGTDGRKSRGTYCGEVGVFLENDYLLPYRQRQAEADKLRDELARMRDQAQRDRIDAIQQQPVAPPVVVPDVVAPPGAIVAPKGPKRGAPPLFVLIPIGLAAAFVAFGLLKF